MANVLKLSKAQTQYLALCASTGAAHDLEIMNALERARVVGVLDAWAKRVAGRAHTLRNGDMSEVCDLEFVNGRTKHNKGFFGATPDAARAAAAKAIEAGEV